VGVCLIYLESRCTLVQDPYPGCCLRYGRSIRTLVQAAPQLLARVPLISFPWRMTPNDGVRQTLAAKDCGGPQPTQKED